jgi:glucose-specific phosphotransferase system IIA component
LFKELVLKFSSKIFSILQRVGQSLMVPVSVLPAAGLLIAFGRLFPDSSLMNSLFVKGGLSVFEQLSVLFAIGVAIGFTGGAGVAGLASAVGYFLLKTLLQVIGDHFKLPPIDTGVFGGILVGLTSAWVYFRFSDIQLPSFLGFFSGKRLVPIMTAVMTLFLAAGLSILWPPIQEGIRLFGTWVSDSQFGPAFYAAGKRLLIPVGLHHVYYPSFLYEFGQFVTSSGDIVRGDSARYYAGDPQAGRFMASEFPIMLFGLPAAALAITLRAWQQNRKVISGVMLSAALTSILTGITEPIEFSFIFVAPLLFGLHVVFAFVSGFLTENFDIQLGYTFSASLIDFATGYFNQKNSLYLWLVVGPLMAALYFFSFYYLIEKFNFLTPGRENLNDSLDKISSSVSSSKKSENPELATQILAALGGSSNLVHLDACITRLRLQVKDAALVQENVLKSLGASGTLKSGQNVQVVFGTQSDQIKEQIKNLIQFNFASPLSGRILSLDQVPDPTFAGKILGDGFAIVPDHGLVVSPFDATVETLIGSHHAIGLLSSEGVEVLIHVGIDTVKMKGQGFKALVQEGQSVKKGDALIQFDLELIKKMSPSIVTPVIFTNSGDLIWNAETLINKQTKAAQPLLLILKK